MNATHPLTSAVSPLRLSPIGAGEVEVAMLSDCACDFSANAVSESGCDVITAIKVGARIRESRRWQAIS